MRNAISAVIIEDGKILLVKKGGVFILPGGKPERGELDIEYLIRQARKELSGTELKDFKFYKKIEGTTPHTGDTLQNVVYFAKINGELGQPSSEIGAAEFVGNVSNYNISDITLKVIECLKKDKYM